ncbi:MAG: hypothetical protein GWN00_15165, partial [Aliifodinibius sp.]|nr:hypothetical protein [Fodinibius sp.]NIY26093.1 hypothetical protein [Fodinibius sp.]
MNQAEVEISKIDTTKGNGQFNITVVDNEQLTGDEYMILFHGDPELGNVNFDLINRTTGDSLLRKSKQFIVIDPDAQFKTIPPRIDGLEWEIRTAVQPLIDKENI